MAALFSGGLRKLQCCVNIPHIVLFFMMMMGLFDGLRVLHDSTTMCAFGKVDECVGVGPTLVGSTTNKMLFTLIMIFKGRDVQ